VYLADIAANDITDIYAVTFDGQDANLELIATNETEIHIAFNETNNLLYGVNKSDGSYRILDPSDANPQFGPVNMIDADVSDIVTAAFNQAGELLIGSQTSNIIYNVDLSDNSVGVYDSFSPIQGGDIAFATDGSLYLATRQGGGELYEVNPDELMADVQIGSAPSLVTGLALSSTEQLLLSHRDSNKLDVRNLNGSLDAAFNLKLNGESFTTFNGDMASGCPGSEPGDDDCSNFSTFYVNHGPGISGSDLYRVAFDNGVAELSLTGNVDFEAHIAYNAADDVVYMVNANGSFVRLYDPTSQTVIGDVAINGSINQLYAVVYNPEDGLIYAGDANDNEIYTIDPILGDVNFFADAPINGGDLAIQNGELYLANRSQSALYRIDGGVAVNVGNLPAEVNGMAQANNATGLVVASGGTDQFWSWR
ncbi:MAG: hypothetical protein LC687_03440, partial [Actinobacteria bacterium]|nr:hypothetical protein [Actinomycetota bacterium]